MRVGIDLDGVCYDFAGSLRRFLKDVAFPGSGAMYPEATHWEFYKDWGLTTAEFIRMCDRAVDSDMMFREGDPLPRVRDAFELIKSQGHSIHIVTDRFFGTPGVSQDHTIFWLHRHHLPFDHITFTSDKTVVKLDTMCDDKPENYEALTDSGVETYLLTQKWNQHVSNASRVLDLYHYAELVTNQ